MRQFAITALLAAFVSALAFGHAGSEKWGQWGGPHRDFQAAPVELAEEWPEDGPPVVWRRPLGDGNSAISIMGRRLVTMYRNGDQESVIALDRRTGETLWQRSWPAPVWEGFYDQFGLGPHSTPLVTGDRVFTAGIGGRFVCLELATGKLLWERELWEGIELQPEGFGPQALGYTSSALLHRKLVITMGGATGQAVVALDMETGATAWAAGDFEPTFASPLMIGVGNEKQLVAFGADRVAGLDPDTGALLWEAMHPTQYKVNASTPLWDGASTLFISSAYDTGSRALRLEKGESATKVEELWATREVEVHHQTSVLIDGRIFASSGDFGPAFLIALDPKTGELLFRQRGFAKANLIAVGKDVIILDEDGVLAIGSAGAEGIAVHAKAQVFDTRSWTVPTLIGTTLYARDRKEIVALDLSPQESTAQSSVR